MRNSRLLALCASIFIAAIAADLSPCRADGGKYFQPPSAPLRWAQAPHARTSSAVTMAVEPAGQAGAVEYLFDCVSGDGHDSGWQGSPSYTDSHLTPDTEYAYVVKARDKASKKPCSPPSPAVSVRTRTDGKGSVGHVAAIDKALAAGRLERIGLMVTGPTANRINIVAINRWVPGSSNPYNKPELREEFIADARHVLKAFDATDEASIDPYPAYRDFFNVYAVWWPDMPPWNPKDRVKGMHWEDYNEIRARLFLPWRIEGKGWVTHLAMVNSSGGGGGAGRRLDERVGDAMIAGNEIDAFIHEFNHTAPGCPDEYTSSGLWGSGREGLTTTNEHRREFVNWRAWIEPGTPVPTPYSSKYIDKVGLFEGGVHRMAHLFRPTARGCIMGAGSFAGTPEGMCPACKQGAVQRFYHWVRAVDRVQPARDAISIDGARTVRFAVSRIKPRPDTQKTEWRLNGRVIATGVDEVDVTFGALAEYELAFSLTDETPFIRPDPPYSRYPRAETRWKITNTRPRSDAKPLAISLTSRPPVFRDVQDGAVTAAVAGGQPPYTYAWSDGASLRDRTGLAPGRYELRVTDSDFRIASAAVDLDRAADVDASLRSEFRGGGWQVTAEGAKDESVKAVWSNGAKGPRAEKLADGTYTCTLRHAGGSEVVRSVTLAKPAEPLTAKAGDVVPVTGGANNGAVSLIVRGGRAPYSFAWSDGAELAAASRPFMPVGAYTVTVTDSNLTERTLVVTVGSEPRLIAPKLSLTKVAPGRVKVSGAAEGSRYLWFDADYPPYIPRFPHGIYTGTFTMPDGRQCQAEAYVIQNKGGLYIDAERRGRNNYGFWIQARAFVRGRQAEPLTVEVQTTGNGKAPRELVIQDQKVGDLTWFGEVADGRLVLQAKNSTGNDFRLLYASRPAEPDKPLCVGDEFSPPASGNYFVAVQDARTGAISNNRVGLAITVGGSEPEVKAVAPDKAGSAKLLMWLDASDVDGDGKADVEPPRRGSIMGWQGKAGGVDFNDFVYYLPNTQNGLGVASWKTIWLQSISEQVSGYQTIFMVRREHDLSSVGTSPWRDLSGLIGVGEYGKRLMSRDVSDDIRRGAVYVNGRKVDPFKHPMPTDFYVATYEFAKPVSKAFRRTDGHWEGQLAEVLVFDGKLSDSERAGIEQYLRRKWVSAVHLESPGKTAAAAKEK